MYRDRYGNHISVETGDIRSPLPVAAQRNIPKVYQRPRQWVEPFNIANLPAVQTGDASSSERGVLAQQRRVRAQRRPQTRTRYQKPVVGRGRPGGIVRTILGRR